MNQSSKKTTISNEDKLAEFTDRVRAGKSGQVDSSADEELHGLEETILRLNRAMPSNEPDKATIKKMEARLNARLRKESRVTHQPFWHKWLAPDWRNNHPRLQIIFAFGVISIIFIGALIASGVTKNGSSITATANTTSQTTLVVAALAGAVLIVFWINRRK